MKNYLKAIRYATKLIKDYNAPYNPKDLVHDSWLMWHKYKDSNLFDQKEGTVLKCVKNMYLNNINKEYSKKGTTEEVKKGIWKYKTVEKTRRINVLINDGSDRNDSTFGEQKKVNIGIEEYTPREEVNPESILISKENHKNLNDSLCEFDRKVLYLKVEGYGNGEIKNMLHTHNVKITESIKNIKKRMHTKSPFAGSNLKIIKKVRRKDFEKNKEEFLNMFEKGEEWDFNDSYEQYTSKENPMEGLLIKEKDSD